MAGLRLRLLVVQLAATAAAIAPARAQETDLTLPPRIESAPGEARLERPSEDRSEMLEAVVKGGRDDWRLPDLGTSLRREREEEKARTQRIEVSFLPLYDPEHQDPTAALFPGIEELRRVGFIRVIELHFGHRD